MQLLTPEAVLGQNEQFLLYGEPGTGKTELALTAPGPIYYLCVGPENELKTRYSKHFLTRQEGKHADKVVYFDSVRETLGKRGAITDNPTGLDEAGDTLDNALQSFEKGEHEPPKTIVIDNATILEEYQMNKAMIAGHELATDTEKTALARYRKFGIIKPGDSDYGGAQSLMAKWVSWIMGLPYHLVFVAHEYTEYTGTRDKKKVESRKPLFVGQQRTSIAGKFDNVWRLYTSGTGRSQQFHVRTIKNETDAAKTRVGGVLDEVVHSLDLSLCIDTFTKYPKTLKK